LPRSRKVGLYIDSLTGLHGVVLKHLATDVPLPFLLYDYNTGKRLEKYIPVPRPTVFEIRL
jgi:hypothetical protein